MSLRDDVRLLRTNRDWRGRSRVPRSAEPWAPRRERRLFPSAWARTPAARTAREAIQRGMLRPVAWTTTRPQVYGRDRIAGVRGPVILVSNHASHLDTPLILGSLPGRLARATAVGAASDYFFDAHWRATVTALVFNAFPVERQGARRGRSPAPELVEDGWSLLLFPEGTRSPDGWMSRFRHGPAHLCCQHDVPAVPVGIRGTYAAMSRGRFWPKPGRPPVVVRYGEPLYPAADESTRDFGGRVQQAVARLWKEEDVGWWRALRSQADGSLELPTGPDGARWRRVWESSRPLADPGGPRVWPRRC